MAKNYELVRDALERFGADKLAEAQRAFAEHSGWLARAVQDARTQIALHAASGAGVGASDKEAAASTAGAAGKASPRPLLCALHTQDANSVPRSWYRRSTTG